MSTMPAALRGILLPRGNRQALPSHTCSGCVCLWATRAAEVSLLILNICYHSGRCSEESNNTSGGTKVHFWAGVSSRFIQCGLGLGQLVLNMSAWRWLKPYTTRYSSFALPNFLLLGPNLRQNTHQKPVSSFNFFLRLHRGNTSLEVLVLFYVTTLE